MSKVGGFFDKLISIYLNFNGYLGIFDCILQVITNQAKYLKNRVIDLIFFLIN
jgi:hypothetical protein